MSPLYAELPSGQPGSFGSVSGGSGRTYGLGQLLGMPGASFLHCGRSVAAKSMQVSTQVPNTLSVGRLAGPRWFAKGGCCCPAGSFGSGPNMSHWACPRDCEPPLWYVPSVIFPAVREP